LKRVVRWVLLAWVPVLAFLAFRWNARSMVPAVSVEETVLERQTVALQTLVDAADRGALVNLRAGTGRRPIKAWYGTC
jgi:hypothetical protein